MFAPSVLSLLPVFSDAQALTQATQHLAAFLWVPVKSLPQLLLGLASECLRQDGADTSSRPAQHNRAIHTDLDRELGISVYREIRSTNVKNNQPTKEGSESQVNRVEEEKTSGKETCFKEIKPVQLKTTPRAHQSCPALCESPVLFLLTFHFEANCPGQEHIPASVTLKYATTWCFARQLPASRRFLVNCWRHLSTTLCQQQGPDQCCATSLSQAAPAIRYDPQNREGLCSKNFLPNKLH
ncbi:hypothetical protein H8959_011627 [Pygathrix nigripes]